MTRHAGLFLAVILGLVGFFAFGWHSRPPIEDSSLKASTVGEPNLPTSERQQVGRASWYSLPSKTANGEQVDKDDLTAAHPTLPFGTNVEIKNLDNGRKITVRVNDRGPFVGGRIIDVSKAAAQTLDMIVDGTATVRIRPLTGSTE